MQVGLETIIAASLQVVIKDDPSLGRWGILFDQQAVFKLFSWIFISVIPISTAVPFPKFRFNKKDLKASLEMTKWNSQSVQKSAQKLSHFIKILNFF